MIKRAALILAALSLHGPAAAQEGPLGRASWLAGCWEGATGSRVFEERWTPSRGGTMVASARSVRRDTTTSVELVILRARGDTLRYEAHPVGQTPTVFSGTGTRSDSLVFENPQHDFPQKIVYRQVGTDSLHARIEGPMDGQWRGIDYRMARVRCEP